MKDEQQSTLPDDPEQLKAMVLQLQQSLAEKDNRITYLLEQFRLAQLKRYGKSSEGHPAQGLLFDEAEALVEEPEAQSQLEEVKGHQRKQRGRTKLPEALPRETVLHDIPEEEKVCDCCGGELHQMGEEISEQLEFVPATIKVIRNVRPKYSCRSCERTEIEVAIKIAPVPASPIPKSIATPSLLAQIITSKYQYALPLYRQESLFSQLGIELGRKTMANWMLKCGELLRPLYRRLHEVLLAQPVIQADETTLVVAKEDKAKCYMWLYCTGTDSPGGGELPNIVLYEYQADRGSRHPKHFLQGFDGYLQVDGYQGYEHTQATLVGCVAHARRYFKEAEKLLPKGKRSGKIDWALNHIQKLYRIEKQLKGSSPEEIYQRRQAESKPLLTEFKAWLDKSVLQVLPKSPLGKAIGYCLNQWPKLLRYIEDGQLNIDNNRAERAIKPFVVGRKNWLMAQTANGANASATLYSIIETAKANDLEPFGYLTHLFKELPTLSEGADLDHLLPWNVTLPES